jgi:putative membrane protein
MKKVKMAVLTLALGTLGSFAYGQSQGGTAVGGELTDGQIAQVIKTVNEGEVDLGKVARSRAENKDVKEFAKQMVDEHKKSEKQVKDVAKKAKLELVKNDTSKSLEEMVDNQEDNLKKLKGADFDKAYIGHQITMHQQVLDDLNKKWIPAAQSAELKSYLETTKSNLEKHLSHAQQIQNTLSK